MPPTEQPTLPLDTYERELRRGQCYTPLLAGEVGILPPRRRTAWQWARLGLDLLGALAFLALAWLIAFAWAQSGHYFR